MFEKIRGAMDSAVTKVTTKELNDKNLSDAVWEIQLVLIQNDVAVDVAEEVCKRTKEKLLGSRTGRLDNLTKLFKEAIFDSVREVLTPSLSSLSDYSFIVPKGVEPEFSVIPYIVPLQLFSYYMATRKGYDPDKPRNLAKSVTVL